MKSFCLFLCGLIGLTAVPMNYAPNIENPKKEIPMVVVIPSYNNKRYYKGNLDSVFTQKYTNYRVIYTSDASTDETGRLVQEYIEANDLEGKFTFVENKVNVGGMENIYNMVHTCNNDEVIVLLDGDDKFYHDRVLERLNKAYNDERVWMTYGSDTSKLVKKSHSRPTPISILKEAKCRTMPWGWSHLRTFYAGLFKKVPAEKLQKDGEFFRVGWDIGMMFSLMELSREHTFFIPDILYWYNTDNPICDFKVHLRNQQGVRRYVWAQEPLEGLVSKEDFLN